MDPIQQGSSDHVSPKDRRVKGIASQSLSVFMLHLMVLWSSQAAILKDYEA